MKLKTRIVSTVMSMALALSVMGFAVFAAATQTLSITNTVSFVSQHVLATVSGTIEGATGAAAFGDDRVTTANGDTSLEGALGTWEIGDIGFASETAPIIITLTIHNDSAERFFTFELAQTGNPVYDSFYGAPLGDTNINREVTYTATSNGVTTTARYLDESAIRVDANTTATIVFTLQVADTGKSVANFNNSFSVTLINLGVASEGTGGGEEPGGGDEGDGNFVFSPSLASVTIPAGTTVTREDIEVTTGETPETSAFYGLYETKVGEVYSDKVEYPYTTTSETELYAKFGDVQANLDFALINNDTEYAVSGDGSNLTMTVLEIPEIYNQKFVTTIPNDAFNGYTELATISIPDSIYKIGMNEDWDGALTDTAWYANQPSGIVYAGKVAYSYKGTVSDAHDGVSFTNGTNEDDGYHLTFAPGTLGVAAIFVGWDGQENLTKLSLNDELRYIGEWAFWMPNFATIAIPDNVKLVDEYAFYWGALTSVTFTEHSTLTTIGEYAFEENNISSVLIPSTVTYIGRGAFNYNSLTSITIPSNVTFLGSNAFANNALTSLTFAPESSLTTLSGAFDGNDDLTEFTIPDNLTVLSWGVIPNSVTQITFNDVITTISAQAFASSNLTSIIVPATVTTIGDQAFVGSKLVSFEVEENSQLTMIGNGVFQWCGELEAVSLPPTVTSIGDDAFNSCAKLLEVVFPTNLVALGANPFTGCTSIQNIVYPENFEMNISENQFKNFTSLKSITLSNHVTSIGMSAFYGCTSLESVNNANFVTTISSSAFSECTLLTSINLPALTNFAEDTINVFSNSGLTSITLPEQFTIIPTQMFYGCADLVEVIFLGNVTSVGWNAFRDCTSLANISIPSTVTDIGAGAFSGCTSLNNIVLPSGLVSIGNFAFGACSALESISFPASVTSIGRYVFDGALSLTSIIFENGNKLLEEYYTSSTNIFQGVGILDTVILPNDLTSVGSNAFANMQIGSITLPNTVASINNNAFANSSITTIIIPSEVKSISHDAFNGCTKLKTVYIDSADVASGLSLINSQGKLLANFVTDDSLYIKVGIDVIGSYVDSAFTEDLSHDSVGTGYRKWTKN